MPLTRTVPISFGRVALMLAVLLSFLASIGLLFFISRGGAVHVSGITFALKELLEIYLPLLAIMAAFYFAEHAAEAPTTTSSSLESFVFAFSVTAVWIFAPPCLLALTQWPIEDIFAFLNDDAVGLFGQTLAVGAVTYYFSTANLTKQTGELSPQP